jgi:hypothetical protein
LTGLPLFFSLAPGTGRPLPLASRFISIHHSLVILQFGAAGHTRESVNRSQMDVIAFLYVSLGSSRVHSCTCACSVVKMATVLEDCTTKELRTVVRFYGRKDSMQRIFIKKCFLFTMGSVHRVRRFTTGSIKSQGRSEAANDARPGRPLEIATEAAVERVEELIRANRRITIDSVATALGCSHGLAYSIMHDRSKFRKVCAQWVLRELKDREK